MQSCGQRRTATIGVIQMVADAIVDQERGPTTRAIA